MIALIDDLLDASGIEAGSLKMQVREVGLTNLLDEVLCLLTATAESVFWLNGRRRSAPNRRAYLPDRK